MTTQPDPAIDGTTSATLGSDQTIASGIPPYGYPSGPPGGEAPYGYPSGPPGGGSYRTTGAGPDGPDTRWQALPLVSDTRIRRSANDRMLLGVCGGIAEHTDIDPVYLRLAFLVSPFVVSLFWGGIVWGAIGWGGIGFFAYVAAAVVMPRPLA